MDATDLATLLRLHETHSVTSSLEDSQTQSRDAGVRLTNAYGIVATAAREDKLKKTLRETLESEVAVGRSAYTTEICFHALLQAVLWALGAPDGAHEGEQLRATVFVTSLQLLHATNAASIAQRCLPLLLEELHSLRVTELATAVSELLRGVQQSQRAQRNGGAGSWFDALAIFYTIELLPQVLLRVSKSMTLSFEASQADADGDLSGPQYRQRVLAKLSELAWPRRFFLQVLRNFRDFTLTTDEERTFCVKIYQEARKELNNATNQVRSLEIFPTVCLSVLQLVGRTQNVLCTRLLTRLLINKCQQLTTSTPERGQGRPELTERELRQLQSTVLYHVDVAMRQWERLGEAIKIEYEQRASLKLSSFDIALMLLIASHRKYEQPMVQLLLHHLVGTYTLKHQRASDGRDEAVARNAYLSVIQHAFDGNWIQVVHQMIELSFQLVEYRGSKTDSQQQGMNEGRADTGNTSEWVEFGIRLLLACFQHHQPVREKVLDRVVNMIVVQNADCRIYIHILSRIVSRHIAELDGALEVRIRECLEYVTQLDPVLANSLLVALSPLLKIQHSLKEFVILVLRKAMFRKDEDSRIIGIQGFALLLCLSSRIFSRSRTLSQLYSQNVTMLSQGVGGASSMLNPSGVDTDFASQEHQHAIAAEDLYRQFSGIFRKALHLQTRVRAVLYAELVKVFMECPALQQSILKLLFQHYQKYYEFNETMQPPLKFDLSLSRKRGMYEEPLQYLMHTMMYCYEEIKRDVADSDDEETMMDDIPATQAGGENQVVELMDQNFSILFERLKRCELSDFEFDKNATFSADSELGETNRRLALLVMGVAQVAINWSVSHGSFHDKSDSNDVRESWDAVLRYAHIYVWLQRKVMSHDNSIKHIQPANKRKLEKAPMKQDVSATRRASTSLAETEDKQVAISFELSAKLQWATLLTPEAVLSILTFATTRTRNGGLSPDEEDFVLVVAEKGIHLLDLIHTRLASERRTDSKYRRSSGTIEKFRPEEFTQQLSDVFLKLLRVYSNEEVSLILPKGSSTRKRASTESTQPQERMRRIVQACVHGFSWITDMWSRRPHEEYGELMTRALCLNSGDDEESPDYDVEGGDNDGIASVVAPLRKIIDDLLSQEMPEEVSRLLDVMQTVWTKISTGSSPNAEALIPHIEWVKELLVERSGQASPRLLEKYVSMLLRPCANSPFSYETAQQLAQGLRHICNSGDDDADRNVGIETQGVVSFLRLSEKHILTVANSILSKLDESLADMERRVKAYDSEQRRHSLKFKEDDLNALQQLEDETGSQVFRSETEVGSTGRFGVFKSLCKESFDVAGSIRPFVEMSLNNDAASIRIVRLAGRLYKVLVVLLRDKQRRKDASLPRFLRLLFDRVASNLSPALLNFIACLHGESIKSAPKKRASKMAASTKTMTGNSKFIPDVIFQLEQFDLVMIKLSKLCKGQEFNVWCKMRQSLDFRFDKAILKRALKDNIMKKREKADQERAVNDSDGELDNGESLSAEDTLTDVGSTANAGEGAHSEDDDTESAEDEGDSVAEQREGSGKRRRTQAIAEDSDGDDQVDVGEDVEGEEDGDVTDEVEIEAVDEDQSEEEYATYDSLASNEI